ncbi:MAG: hypothetical protein ACFFB3_02400 [Candidatus Hodarchaeota archaeon]
MNASNESNDQEIIRLQEELQHKRQELAAREEEFATEKLEILKEISAIKHSSPSEVISQQTVAKNASMAGQKIASLQNELNQLKRIIQEKETEDRQLNGLIKSKSEELEGIMTQIREKSLSQPRAEDLDLLRKEVRNAEHEIRRLRAETEHKTRRIGNLKEQSERISLGEALQSQFKTGNFESSMSSEIVDFCKAKFREAKNLWLDAQNSYSSDLTKYLYNGILAFLCSVDMYHAAISSQIPKPVRNLDVFTERVHVLSKANIRIRTSIAESLIGMLIKMERGIDVAPQASFVNEIKEFLDGMADLFNLEGPIVE